MYNELFDIPEQRDAPTKDCKGKGKVDYSSSSRKLKTKGSGWSEESSTSEELDFVVKKSTKEVLFIRCIDNKCGWRLRAVRLKDSNIFKIKMYVKVHSCSLEFLNRDHRQAKSWVVGELIKSKFKGPGRIYKPRDIIEDMRQDYGINMSYENAWRARENAYERVRGSPEESYNLLRRYGEVLKFTNPGFLNCIRPVIVMDGTFLKNKYRGAIGEVPNLGFVTDRKTCFAKGISSVFPSAFHGLCVQHLSQNLHDKYKNDMVATLFYNASRTYRESTFVEAWRHLLAFPNGSGKYLNDVGIARWSRVHCPGRRYNMMTTNIAESMNSILKEPRDFPIASFLENVRALLQRWFWECREEDIKVTSTLTKWAELVIQKKQEGALTMKVNPIDCYQFHVKDLDKEEVVNLQTKECTCKEFQAEQLPCSHAIAAAQDFHCSLRPFLSQSIFFVNVKRMAVPSDKYFPATVSCQVHKIGSLIKDKLTKDQLQMFEKTIFGPLLNVNMVFNGQLIHHFLLRQIPEDGNADGICFSVLGKNVRFTQKEFNIITGLWPTNNLLEKDCDSKCLQSLLFGSKNKKLITCLEIEEIFKNFEFTNDDDAVKVALAIFIETVMVGKDKKTQFDMDILGRVDDEEAFKSFDWSTFFYTRLLNSLKTSLQGKKEAYELKKTRSSKAVSYYNIKGYVLAFQIVVQPKLKMSTQEKAFMDSRIRGDDNMQMEDDESIGAIRLISTKRTTVTPKRTKSNKQQPTEEQHTEQHTEHHEETQREHQQECGSDISIDGRDADLLMTIRDISDSLSDKIQKETDLPQMITTLPLVSQPLALCELAPLDQTVHEESQLIYEDEQGNPSTTSAQIISESTTPVPDVEIREVDRYNPMWQVDPKLWKEYLQWKTSRKTTHEQRKVVSTTRKKDFFRQLEENTWIHGDNKMLHLKHLCKLSSILHSSFLLGINKPDCIVWNHIFDTHLVTPDNKKAEWTDPTAHLTIWTEKDMEYYFNTAVGDYDHIPGWGDVNYVISCINIKEHWLVIAADLRKCKIYVFDSMPNYVEQKLVNETLQMPARCIPSLAIAIGVNLHSDHFTYDPWPIRRSKATLQKGRSLDCGIFCSKFVECLVTGSDLGCLTVPNMKLFRQQYMLELWANKYFC
ncbi:MuDRA-like transposase [Cucumis melo var. makuwa]|uniref:MuDRA-like transposase n=1 Tax=Cucumis melo var. makuwa TaxID=1194695 RepID=A0A5A7TW86_CUCMM|nr:MuDRA-like transposase [Cucumis melo var. makuwa]